MKIEIEQIRYKSDYGDMILRKESNGKARIWIEPEGEFFEIQPSHMPEIVKFFDALMALEGEE